jgi:hypothetical protein
MTEAPPLKLSGPPEPPETECDQILGAYMRSWDQIDHAIFELFQKLVDTNQDAAYILFHSTTDAGARRQTIEALGNSRLKTADQIKLSSLLERMKKATARRNRLIHGKWAIAVNIHRDKHGAERARTATWMRTYMPTDLERISEMMKTPKIRRQYEYNMQQIKNITAESRKLAYEIREFAQAVSLKPYVAPLPIDIPAEPPA